MIAVAVRDDGEVEPLQVDAERPHIAGEDLPVVAGVEQNAAAAILDEGGEAPVELETGAIAERVVEDRHSARGERGGAGCR